MVLAVFLANCPTSNGVQALIDIPIMGRRKFSMRGKLHGRNELIREYLWISYVQSLAPSQEPDETMHRTRKQISSHIQVLKGFVKDNPECEFPTRCGRAQLTSDSSTPFPQKENSRKWL